MFDKENPFLAKLTERTLLNKPGSKKQVFHLEIDLEKSGIHYKPGDSLGICPINNPVMADLILDILELTGKEVVADPISEENYPLRDYLIKRANLSRIGKSVLETIYQYQPEETLKQELGELLKPENAEECTNILNNHHLWDCLMYHHQARIPPQDLVNSLTQIVPRLYSIASSMNHIGERVELTVAINQYVTGEFIRHGMCTHYLTELVPINERVLPIFPKEAPHFSLPEDHGKPIIMIGPGTGIAPFRGFLQERLLADDSGPNWLFFGEWNEEYDFYYREYLESLVAENRLKLNTAFSRDQEHKVYVQHLLKMEGEEIWKWIEKGAHVYVCGDAKRMAKDVKKVFLEIFEEFGEMSDKDAKKFLKQLRKDHRFQQDVY